ncbi:hypothetical protein [Duganella aceris]|uniref:DoxX family protein n=1 Tax=Duganella aceris TaxID=2703883 RepID=A0ABX0FPB2_9BURK|nr:hypothetical protein [Duganella aceris]NGZ86333.1 hypothetical protein [Duganella aceris]
MRGFHSSFPRGSAGFGLLMLRLAVGLQLLFESRCTGALPWWQAALVSVVGLALLLGVLTPAAAALSAAFQLTCLAHAGWAHAAPLLVAAMTAVTLVLIGPGAYSLDARLFGRRRLVLPMSSDGKRF